MVLSWRYAPGPGLPTLAALTKSSSRLDVPILLPGMFANDPLNEYWPGPGLCLLEAKEDGVLRPKT